MQNQQTIGGLCEKIKEFQKLKYHRNQSWEYCYEFFRNYKTFRGDEKALDLAALQLGFFLASWGMFRGSTVLLQANYKYYVRVVDLLIKEEHDALWDVNYQEEKNQETNLKLLFALCEKLHGVMKENNKEIEGKYKDKVPTETLITKIIMATMGCVPAYDDFFKKGLQNFLKRSGQNRKNHFNKESFEILLKFSRENELLCTIYKEDISIINSKYKYPPMKLLDYYFWEEGRNQSG